MNCGHLLLIGCIAFAGCAAQPIYVPLPTSHPASPWACESPVPAQSTTLSIRQDDRVPPHLDWQIPGMRDNELHSHAAGQPSAMDMMGHGHMMGREHGATQQGHGAHGGSEHPPGMVKMSAPQGKVDYAPEGAIHPSGREPKEHEPERHLDHTDPARRKSGFKAAPLAPTMGHSEEGHEGHKMPSKAEPATATGSKAAAKEEAAPVDHEAMGHSAHDAQSDEMQEEKPTPVDHESMGHSGHSTPSDEESEEKTAPAETPAPAMDHSNHG